MRKLILFFMLCFAINLLQAQTELAVSNSETNPQPNATAKIVLYRPYALVGWAVSPKSILGGQKVKLRNRQVREIEVPVGEYNVKNNRRTLFTHKIGVQLNAEAGKTYYVRYRVISDFFYTIDEFVLVDENFAKQEIAKGKFKTKK